MILYNANIVTFWPSQPLVDGALLAVEGKTIVDFGKMGKLIDRYDDPESLDVGGRLVLPGMIDAHARLSHRLKAGSEIPLERLEQHLDESALYVGSVVALMDAVRSGTTTLFAFHSSPNSVRGSLDAVRRAFEDVGLRGAAAYAIDAASNVDEAIAENASQSTHTSEMFRGLFGLRMSPELDERGIQRAIDKAGELDARFHVSLAHTREEMDEWLSRFGATPIGRLAQLELWHRRGLLARATHRLPADDVLLRESGVWLVDCPLSGLVDASPSPELAHLRAAESRVATGTDGLGDGLVGEFRRSALRQRARGSDLESAARLAFHGSFHGNAELATSHFGPSLGCIRPGARADLVVLDHVPSTPLEASNVARYFLANPGMDRVHTVVVNGRILYHNGEFAHIDEARMRARARETSQQLWERIG